MKYAVIRLAGRQYKISEGDEILVDRITEEKPEIEVLMLSDENKVEVGKPTLSKARIDYQILGEEKGDKVKVVKYKSKSRYRKARGFTPLYTKIKVEKISSK